MAGSPENKNKFVGAFKTVKKVEIGLGAAGILVGFPGAVLFTGFEVAQLGAVKAGENWQENRRKGKGLRVSEQLSSRREGVIFDSSRQVS